MDVESAYRKLGLAPGAPFREVMEVHRDLISVWDPRRFDDNPHLRRRATDETAALNEAFQTLKAHLHHADPRPHVSGTARGPSVSLYDDALAGRRKRAGRSPLTWVSLAVVAALGLALAVSLLNTPDQSTPPDPDVPVALPQGVDAGTPPQSSADPSLQPEETSPGQGGRSAESEASAQPGSPAWEAFATLRRRSAVVATLVGEGRYQDLEFVSWRPVRAAPPEILVDIRARDSHGQNVHLVWGVNLEDSKVRAMSEAAQALDSRSSGPTPNLVREE